MTEQIKVDIRLLNELTKKPQYGTMGDALWTDPHIAQQMLKCHLNPDIDAASRKRDCIDNTCKWLKASLNLSPGKKLLDLGCGPGLYAEQFSKLGLQVTGVDFSLVSINYAKESAQRAGLDIEYVCGNYLSAEFDAGFDAAVIIYYDLGVLFPSHRDALLNRVCTALRPGGWLAFDVLAPDHKTAYSRDWSAWAGSGFYRPNSHLVFTDTYHYPREQAWLEQYIVWDTEGPRVIRTWDHYYTPAGITAVLEKAGFSVRNIRADLTGTELSDPIKTMAVLAQKA